MIIRDNTRQRGARQEQRVLRGEVQRRRLHPASQRQMQHPETPQQLQWVWTLQGGDQMGTWVSTEAPAVQNGPNSNPK